MVIGGAKTIFEGVTDEQLVDKFREGDQDAFAELVERYHSHIINSVSKRLGFNNAEEYAQLAFIRVFTGIHKFDASRATFRKWLFWLVANGIRDGRRRSSHRIKAASLDTLLVDEIQADRLEPVDELMPQPSDEIVGRDWNHEFWEFVDTLPPHHREVLYLFCTDGMTRGKVGKALGVKKDACNQRLRAAFGKIQARFPDMPAGVDLSRRAPDQTQVA